MRLRRRDVAALVLALVAAVSGLAAWVTGTVNLGLTLGTDESGFVRVVAVDWESIAWRNGIRPGDLVTGLEAAGDAAPALRSVPEAGSSAQIQIPTEPLPEPLIASVQTGYLDENGAVSCCGGSLARSDALLQLADGGWLLFLGLVAGALTLYAVAFGALGPRWQPEATPLAVAVAVPFMMAPVLYTGTAIGFAASCVLPAVAALPVARSLADLHPEDRWPRALFGTALVLAGAVALLTVRSLTGSAASMDRTELFTLMAGVAAVPALASALAGERAVAQRVEMVAIGVTPAAAMTVLQSYYAETFPLALVWLAGLLAWRKVPTAWVGRAVRAGRSALAAGGSRLSREATAHARLLGRSWIPRWPRARPTFEIDRRCSLPAPPPSPQSPHSVTRGRSSLERGSAAWWRSPCAADSSARRGPMQRYPSAAPSRYRWRWPSRRAVAQRPLSRSCFLPWAPCRWHICSPPGIRIQPSRGPYSSSRAW
jgi:hypothetical protein